MTSERVGKKRGRVGGHKTSESGTSVPREREGGYKTRERESGTSAGACVAQARVAPDEPKP